MMDDFSFRAMNTEILLAAEGETKNLERAFQEARQLIDQSERRFTRFSPDSELSALNRSAGSWFQASSQMFEVVKLARGYAEETGGLFNPCILPALEYIGYDRSMDEIRRAGELPEKAEDPPAVADWREIELDEGSLAVRLPGSARLDLGGIAKGWIAEQAALCLSYQTGGACAVDAGGDMFLIGVPSGEAFWRVSLEDPRQPEQDAAALRLGPGAIATSTTTKRRWRQGRVRQHHLIDPRSGEAARSEWLSMTVIAPHAALAEVYAKALLIAGKQGSAALAARKPYLAFLAIDQEGKLWGSENIQNYLL